jgi:hypothetical protein
MSENEDRLPQFLDSAQLAANPPGLVDQSTEFRNGSFALSGRETSLALGLTPESTSSSPCAPWYADTIELASSHHDDGYLGDPPMTRLHATFLRTSYTNAKQESAVFFSLEYEPLLRGLLSSNIAEIRQGFLALLSWNIEIWKIHNIEQFESLFSILCHKEDVYIPRSILGEMCAVAAISGQFVSHLLAPGLINYWYGKSALGVLAGLVCQS